MDRTSWLSLGVLAAVFALVVLGGLAYSPRARAFTTPPPFQMGYGSASTGGLDSSGGASGDASFDISGAGSFSGEYSLGTYWSPETMGSLAIDALDATGLFDGGLSDILGGALTAYGLYVDAEGHVYTSNPDDPQYKQYAGCAQYSTACYSVTLPTGKRYFFGSFGDAQSFVESHLTPAPVGWSESPAVQSDGQLCSHQGPPGSPDEYLVCNDPEIDFASCGTAGGCPAPPNPDQPQLATPDQVAQALAQEDPGIAPQLVNNAQGQEWNTPNVAQAAGQLDAQIATQTGEQVGNPDPAPSASSGPAPAGSLVEPAPASTVVPSTPSANLPAFCSWAGIVCDFINWMEDKPVQKPQPQLPVNPAPAGSSWSSGLGDGSCPAPYPFKVLGASFTLDLSPICDLMTDIRGLVLAACGLIAAFILAGTTRRG